jgi:SAM-dependent methyltransferase
VKDYHEELWERLPPKLEAPGQKLRDRFLSAHVRPGARVLDLGCGEGRMTGLIARAGARPIGVDIAQAALARARAGHPELDFRLAAPDGELPLEDASVELVWAGEVIEHVGDTARWLSEVRRVLAPDGWLLLTTPDHGRARLLLGGIERYSPPLGDHLHLYTRRSLRRLLEDFDLVEVRVRAAGGLPGLRRQLLARARRPRLGTGFPQAGRRPRLGAGLPQAGRRPRLGAGIAAAGRRRGTRGKASPGGACGS